MGTPLDRDPYVSLLSWKRDGSGVETPVWAAPLDGKLVVFTLKDSFKVKRVRRNPKGVGECRGEKSQRAVEPDLPHPRPDHRPFRRNKGLVLLAIDEQPVTADAPGVVRVEGQGFSSHGVR